MKNKILLVDDDELILDPMRVCLEAQNYEVLLATDGVKALELFRVEPVLVVITDLEMNGMHGVDLIKNLLMFENKPLIIVQSSESGLDLIIELMQKGVHDYLLKPFKIPELKIRVEKAYEVAELKLLKATIEKERQVRITHMLNLTEWKESLIKKDQDKVGGNLIGSIRTSFSQGTGLGSLLSAIGRIQKKAKEKEDYFEVSKPMMNFLFENAKNTMRVIEVLAEIDKLQSSTLSFEQCSLSEFHFFIDSIVNKVKEYESFKNQKIIMCENKFLHYPQNLMIHIESFEKAMIELLFNAIKFSKIGSKIYIIMEVKLKSISISIINSPEQDDVGVYGILPEYSNIIFEPFFRISKLVFEYIPTLDFGLGLTMVDKVIRKHNGKIKANNLVGYLERDDAGKPGTIVEFEIEIPAYEIRS